MPNGTYGGVRGRKTKVGRKLLLFSSYSIVSITVSFFAGLDFNLIFPDFDNDSPYACALCASASTSGLIASC